MKGQDVLVALKLLCWRSANWSYQELARELGLSASEVHAAVKRCMESGLVSRHTKLANQEALKEFLVHGVRYVFPASPGGVVQGLPTSYAAPPLSEKMRFDVREAPVMPLPGGPVRGPEVKPLYRSAPWAASHDAQLYELLALVDALRTGRVRERKLAVDVLEGLLSRDD